MPASTPAPPVARLQSLATAVPQHTLSQAEVAAAGARLFRTDRLATVYRNARVENRHACMPLDWFMEPRGLAERNDLFLGFALELLAEAAARALIDAGLQPADIDAIVVASTTGIATPTLDARLMGQLAFRADVRRMPLFGLGCAAGVIGLIRAADLARTRPQERVLLLVVDLCSLAFRFDDRSRSAIAATALFGDGAAAAVVSCRSDAAGPALGASAEHTWPNGPDIMNWAPGGAGPTILISRELPHAVQRDVCPVAIAFLKREGLDVSDIAAFACHPGGARVIDALEAGFGLADGALVHSRAVLRDYGNMSAATALFVLEAVLDDDAVSGPVLLTAVGPGFSAGMMLVHG